jgi:hypothetical protein
MSKRSERREADRLERKLAYQALRQQSTQPAPVTEAQLAANRANARLSTGPSTPAGKAASSLNALKHGLTGKTVLLPHEDAALYQGELSELIETHQPATDEELRLVQSIHDCAWRISRIQRIEIGILLKGDLEFADKYQERTPFERTHLIQAESYIKYEKQLRNLNIQEGRLRRTREKDLAELQRLQAQRHGEEAQNPPQPQNGFEFSTPQTSNSPSVETPICPATQPPGLANTNGLSLS